MRSQRAARIAHSTRVGVVLWSLLVPLLTLSPPARADFVPTHGFGPHLDPFVGGPVALGAVGPPAAGGPGEVVPPFISGVAWAIPFTAPATDVMLAPAATWHWESEIDVPGLVGPVPVSFNGGVPVVVVFGPGSDLYYHANQPDLAGSVFPLVVYGEVGPVWKQLVNLTPFPVAWGTSVSEDVGTLGYREALALQTPPGTLPALPFIFGRSNVIELSFNPMTGTLGFTEVLIPDPIPVPTMSLWGWAVLGSLIALSGSALFARTPAKAA